jgi:hypothetical protein
MIQTIRKKNSLEQTSICSKKKLLTYFSCLVDVFIKRQSVFLWILNVHLFSSFIPKKQTSCGDLFFNFTFWYREDVLSLNKKIVDTAIAASYLDTYNIEIGSE